MKRQMKVLQSLLWAVLLSGSVNYVITKLSSQSDEGNYSYHIISYIALYTKAISKHGLSTTNHKIEKYCYTVYGLPFFTLAEFVMVSTLVRYYYFLY